MWVGVQKMNLGPWKIQKIYTILVCNVWLLIEFQNVSSVIVVRT